MRNTIRVALAIVAASFAVAIAAAPPDVSGVREPAWAPDGKHIVVSLVDRLWTMAPDGRQAKALTASDAVRTERDPSWSPDGKWIAFATDAGSGFDVHVISAKGGAETVVTSMAGDERWPSWTRDGRLVFAHRAALTSGPSPQWDLYLAAPEAAGGWKAAVRMTDSPDNEIEPRVSPDGTRILFVSDRTSDEGETDLWVMRFAEPGAAATDRRAPRPVRVTNAAGPEGGASWAPTSDRVAFYAVREGIVSTWVAGVEPIPARLGEPVERARPAASPQLVSRHGGATAWAPDGRTILVADLPEPDPSYNGNPQRSADDPPPLFEFGRAFTLWTVEAPAPVDTASRTIAPDINAGTVHLVTAFDRVFETLRRLYYSTGPSAAAWTSLGAKYRPQAQQAADEPALETVIDQMVAEQPLIKPAVVSTRAVVVSGNPLASEAGRIALEKGGNIVDAIVATSFALGVVEPDASSVGGDGMAILYLKGMKEPVIIDYKDQSPIHATLDNAQIFRQGRLIADGAAAANIPGVVAGLDYLHRTYGSGKVSWADLIAPAIKLAEEGFVLDEALPTTIAEGRRFLEKYPEARRIFLPNGTVPKPGDRFVNKDYAATLRAIAKGGADTFYRGELARAIAADMTANGGIIGTEDLAQYRAIERHPLVGEYRGHRVYGSAPPVSSGATLIETLQILDHYKPAAGATIASNADYFHYVIESWKVRDRAARINDPDRWAVELGDHLKPEHAATLFKKIDPNKASRSEPQIDDSAPEIPRERIGRGTTGFAAADADGNMVAITQTLSTWGGNFYVSKGLGFLYNNHLRSTRTAPNTYGQLLPLVRSSSTSNPTLVFKATGDGTPGVARLAVAAAGNAWITSSVFSIICNVIDGGMPMQRAVEAPRYLLGRDPADPLGTASRVQIEDRIPRATLMDLMKRGHAFQKIGRKGEVRYGYASGVLVDIAAGKVEGGADPRRSHGAVAFEGVRTTTAGGSGGR
jgi:gamma-glutamyltranspeptidase